jgi:putative ABC transport system ATP-binding protein
MPLLVFEDIWKSYQVGPTVLDVLKGISITVEKGELLAIVGPSGCGKSTLMNIIGLLDKPSSGNYHIEGEKIGYDDDRILSSIRNKNIGFVFQQYYLLPRLNALDNVGLPLAYRNVPKTEIADRSMEYLKRVEMQDRAHHKPDEMSGGQQQRVAIARALVGKPTLILADEPTGALDSSTGQDIMNLFTKVNEEEGVTVIIITHDQKIAAQCRRSLKMMDGRICE